MQHFTPDGLAQLEARRQRIHQQATELLETRQAQGIENLSGPDSVRFQALKRDLRDLDNAIVEYRVDAARSQVAPHLASLGGAGGDIEQRGRQWATSTYEHIRRALGGGTEQRAVVAGSVDVPVLIDMPVVKIPFPKRLIDVFGNRRQIDSMAYEYYVQSAPRVNAAAPVPDLAAKSTSQLTVTAVTDRCRVIAHLSDYLPIRIWWDFQSITAWLQDQMFNCVLDAIEHQAISGDGTGENMVGILNTPGVTAVPYVTDLVTTLRSAQSALQNLGEQPNGWALNPADAQTIDLMRWGSAGGFLSGGYENDSGSQYGTSENVFGPSSIARVVTPHLPAGTALLADFDQLQLFFRQYMRLDIDPYTGFNKNAIRLRSESFCGIGILRPQAFAVVKLSAGKAGSK